MQALYIFSSCLLPGRAGVPGKDWYRKAFLLAKCNAHPISIDDLDSAFAVEVMTVCMKCPNCIKPHTGLRQVERRYHPPVCSLPTLTLSAISWSITPFRTISSISASTLMREDEVTVTGRIRKRLTYTNFVCSCSRMLGSWSHIVAPSTSHAVH